VLNEHYDTRTEEREREHRLEVLEKIYDGYGDTEATIDASELVEMFVNNDGTVDKKALIEFNNDDEEEDLSDLIGDESSPGEQKTFDQSSDGINGIFHPALVRAVDDLTVVQLVVNRTQDELDSLTTEPGTSLRPSKERMAKGAAAYAIFVSLIAFNLASLGLLPAGTA
jgi:hypothetical protein